MERKFIQRSFDLIEEVHELRLLQTLVRSARILLDTLQITQRYPGGMSRGVFEELKFQVRCLKRTLKTTIHSIPAVKKLALDSVNLAIPKFRIRINRRKRRLIHKINLLLQTGGYLLMNTVVTPNIPSGAHSGEVRPTAYLGTCS